MTGGTTIGGRSQYPCRIAFSVVVAPRQRAAFPISEDKPTWLSARFPTGITLQHRI